MFKETQESIDFLNPFYNQAKIGIILGTGLGALVNDLMIEHAVPYAEIPHFPVSTVESHQGKLLFGKLNTIPVLSLIHI